MGRRRSVLARGWMEKSSWVLWVPFRVCFGGRAVTEGEELGLAEGALLSTADSLVAFLPLLDAQPRLSDAHFVQDRCRSQPRFDAGRSLQRHLPARGLEQ